MREAMLTIHFLGLAMGLGTSFAVLFLGMASAQMEPAKGREFMLNVTHIGRMGHVGIVLLLISGGYLMTPYWSTLGDNPLLIAKLVLYVVLAGLVGMITSLTRKARGGRLEVMPKAVLMGRLAMLIGITIVILAVSIFH
jgi:uncharacterized membrane protein